MKFLERHWLCDGNCECRMPINILTKEDALCPWLGGEVDLPLLHRDLARRGFARSTGLRPNHFDGKKVARDRQDLLRDSREGEGF